MVSKDLERDLEQVGGWPEVKQLPAAQNINEHSDLCRTFFPHNSVLFIPFWYCFANCFIRSKTQKMETIKVDLFDDWLTDLIKG